MKVALLLAVLALGCKREPPTEGTVEHPWRLYVFDAELDTKAKQVVEPYYGANAKEECEKAAKSRLELWELSHQKTKFRAWCERP